VKTARRALVCLIAPALLVAGLVSAEGVELKVSHQSGLYSNAFDLTLTGPGTAKIYFTTNAELPAPSTAQAYGGPVRIGATTIFRCAAFDASGRVSLVLTRSFLFPEQALGQTGAGFPMSWGTNQGKPVPADYEMDPEITNHPAYREDLVKGLRAIPAVSIVLSSSALFDPITGIYSNPMKSGDEWERPASVEFLDAQNGSRFEIDCGLRIQGGWNRRPEESPKHAFRLAFRKQYGAGKLKFALFEDPGTKEFNGLILRAGCNNTWLHWNGAERRQGEYIRDQWMRDTYAAMGRPSARGRFVHVYLNGLYWGVFNLTERPDEDFAAGHFGGKARDYDARNGENILSGDDVAWKQMLTLANGGISNVTSYEAIGQFLDLPAFADFMIVNLYGANADWDRASNWYAARRRNPPGPFHFFVWDGERTLESPQANTIARDDDQSPLRLFQRLRENADFRRLFAGRVRLHCSYQGALAPAAAAERFRKWSSLLDLAIVAESARWGDYRRDVHQYKAGPYELYTRDDHWRPEVDRLLNDYFPKRAGIMLEQFRAAGLYSGTEPAN
jgi:hypothetical protein